MNSEFDVTVAYLSVPQYSSRISTSRPVSIPNDCTLKSAFSENRWNKCKKQSSLKPRGSCEKWCHALSSYSRRCLPTGGVSRAWTK